MNGHVTKLIDVKDLIEKLNRFLISQGQEKSVPK
jgi:hypothetical protein